MTCNEVLEKLCRSNVQITDYGPGVGQILIDPSLGSSGPCQRIEPEVFALLHEHGWLTTNDTGAVRRYVISAAGMDRAMARTA